jgi:hypothetical protein
VSLQVAPTCGEATAEGQMALAAAETLGAHGYASATYFAASGDAPRSHSACRNAVTSARRRCCCVGLLEAVWPTGPGTGLGLAVRGSAAREFPDEGAWQADVGDRGGVGDELCRAASHGRFGGPDAWLQAVPDYQLGLVKCV